MTPHSGVASRNAVSSDAGDGASVLADAFAEDETFRWIQPDDRLRARLERGLFAAVVRHFHPLEHGGQVVEHDDRLVGVAAWVPPESPDPARWRSVVASAGMVRRVGLGNLGALAQRGGPLETALQAARPSEPHWYLNVLGVRRSHHGSGAGAALLRSGLERADRDHTPAYLECLERLVPYYQRHGFDVRQVLPLPDGAPSQVGMWRAPGAAGPLG